MATNMASMVCQLYASAFSGEVVFAVKDAKGHIHEGVAPKHFAFTETDLSSHAVDGTMRVRLIRNGGNTAYVAFPDGESAEVPANIVVY